MNRDETRDNYMSCPRCNSMNLYRDIFDNVTSCHECGFSHLVGVETAQDAIDKANRAAIARYEAAEAGLQSPDLEDEQAHVFAMLHSATELNRAGYVLVGNQWQRREGVEDE